MQKKIMAIERLRAVAVIMVYLVHVPLYGDAWGIFRPLSALGTWAGVDLFFVISGFVVALSLERVLPPRPDRSLFSPISLRSGNAMRSFYFRRFFRLAPLALFAILLHLVGAVLGPMLAPSTPFMNVTEWSEETLAIVSGLYNFVAPYLDHPAMAFFWSLSVEEQFYLLLPPLFLLGGRRRTRVILAASMLLAVAVVIRPIFSPHQFTLAHYSSQYRFDALAAGVVLGILRDHVVLFALWLGPWIRKALVVLSLGTLIYVSRHTPIWFAIRFGLIAIWGASVCVVGVAITSSRDVLDFPWVNRALEHIGSRSYAIYVIHTAFLMAVNTLSLAASPRVRHLLDGRVGQTLEFVVTAALVLGAAELAHRYIELPSIRYGKEVAARRAAAKLAKEQQDHPEEQPV